jgi:hypothetical protein
MWGYIAGIAFKIIEFWMDKIGASEEAKRKFLDFIDAVDRSSLDASKVLTNYQKQLKRLRDERSVQGS